MIFYFVRHGHPDYKTDSLTELGKLQAQKAAGRLRDCGIQQIFASTNGRAMETAQFTADMLDLPIVPCDFMRELSWRSESGEEIPFNGHPWNLAESLVADGTDLADPDWRQMYPYCKSRVVRKIAATIEGFDALMADLGYRREGKYYRVTGDNTNKTVALFSHAGSSSAVIAHLLNITFPQACASLHMDFTSVTTFSFSDQQGQLICPKMIGFNDAEHIKGITTENVFGC